MDFLSNSVLHFITQYETLLLSMKLYYSHTGEPFFHFFIIRPLHFLQGYVADPHQYHAIQRHDMTEAVQGYCKQ